VNSRTITDSPIIFGSLLEVICMTTTNAKKTNIRYFTLAMLFIVTAIDYADRATLAMAAPAMTKDLALSAVAMRYAFSAFGWSYAAVRIPGGCRSVNR
jgi:ACS family glucarate transporter-like MFS transporter